jgi:hypothetical protein
VSRNTINKITKPENSVSGNMINGDPCKSLVCLSGGLFSYSSFVFSAAKCQTWSTPCHIITHMSHHHTHVTSSHTCHIITHMSHHRTHVTSSHTCHIITHMPLHHTHVTSSHTCHIITHMSHHRTHATSSHTCHIIAHMPHHHTHVTLGVLHALKETLSAISRVSKET